MMYTIARLVLFVLLVFNCTTILADGSKDLYPSGVRGSRAFLNCLPAGYTSFSNLGTHFAFVKKGEILAVASSAQNIGNGRIRITSPSGVITLTDNTDVGRIRVTGNYSAREAELAGPGIGYTPLEISADEEGIWMVEFIPPIGEFASQNVSNPPQNPANGDWDQPDTGYLIAAWDISVRAGSQWIAGRVYATVLNLYLNYESLDNEEGAFYGMNYVLTKDGYVYRVDGNGSHGIQFSYFVNNTGFLDSDGNSSYKSSDEGYNAYIHNPLFADLDNTYITHKMLYSMPDSNLPQMSSGMIPGGSTWLVNPIQVAEIKNISLAGSEGTPNYINLKGSKISFETNYAGRYKITIKSKDSLYAFEQRDILLQATVGVNEYIWDGKDGEGILLPAGRDYLIEILIGLVEGEIHFPYFDMEINPKGIFVQRINPDGNVNGPAIMYWDDSAISPGLWEEQSDPLVNVEGISSYENGHKWGSYRHSTITNQNVNIVNNDYGAASFGNNKGMDTWSYTVQVQESVVKEATVEIADLKIESIEPNKTEIELDEVIIYTVVVKNEGPSDANNSAFSFNLPEGFTIDGVDHSSSCTGGHVNALYTVANVIDATVSLPNGCSLIFSIRARANNVPDETFGVVDALAGIVRPRDFTDPDATSSDTDATSPGTVTEECMDNCNNMMWNTEVFLLEPYNERGQLQILKTVKHIDSDQSGFQEIGEELEYTFTIRNSGMVPITDIFVQDPLLGNTNLIPPTTFLASLEEVSFAVRYKITADDVVKRKVINSAVVKGKNPRKFDVIDVSGSSFEDDEPTVSDIDTKPTLKLKKSVVNQGTGENNQFTLGDEIRYHFDIVHSGDLAVTNIRLEDEKLQEAAVLLSPSLLKNGNTTYTGVYIIDQLDIDRGYVENTATVFGMDEKYQNEISDVSGNSLADDNPTVTIVANPPIATEDSISFFQGGNGWVKVLDNDEKGSSTIDINSLRIVEQPGLGEIFMEGDVIWYEPFTNLVYGEDRFSYSFKDNSGLWSNVASVKVFIRQTVPVALDDRVKIAYNYEATIRPYTNDYVEGSILNIETVNVLSYPSYGTIKLVGNGDIVYVPNDNFTGIDEWTYQIQDKNENWSNQAKITVETTGFFLPNVITPNGDERNDTFVVIGAYLFDRIELEIIDRFGKSVYKNSNYKNDWDASTISEGTYFYIFSGHKINEKSVSRRGSVLITRKINH
ncbi:T9SS type B sorting domain-containing protein [Sphingobacterium alkalisoli]|uniref:T9SS type B sorting domain-containing protein n=1 Tax=Sphingobacterium alkalisoli TaxID=1874115 RepID=A0A4U0GWV8_9SPHI|nr:gliding motility-associated C-terminal domain-containing protein [Sphingobacterium alkalisoli]TJY63528.1 T9SS type B sorting domain-containing protein [Sphingobacterium alkalisoli]GGH26642.1 hypothetical protein GCM10011418_36040 [Sphingobacterium alkalisoli]